MLLRPFLLSWDCGAKYVSRDSGALSIKIEKHRAALYNYNVRLIQSDSAAFLQREEG